MFNYIFVLLGVAAIVYGIVCFVLKRRKALYFIVGGVLLSLCFLSFSIIPTGYTGVKSTFGQIDTNVVSSGFVFKIPFVQRVEKVNNKQQDKTFDGEIWGEASDKTEVFATSVIVTYQINAEKSSYILSNVHNYKENLIPQTLVNSAVKSAMVQLSSDKVTNRTLIEPMAKNMLEKSIMEKYGADAVLINKVTVDNMDFKEEYNKAIEEKQIARQSAERQAIENQKVLDKAKSDQEKAAIDAETKRIEAEGNAKAQQISADAEAYAYQVKSAAITDNLLKKWEMDARIAHGWVEIQGINTVVSDK